MPNVAQNLFSTSDFSENRIDRNIVNDRVSSTEYISGSRHGGRGPETR